MQKGRVGLWALVVCLLGLGNACSKDDSTDGWGPGKRDTSDDTEDTTAPCDSNDSACDTSQNHSGESGESGERDGFDDPGDIVDITSTDAWVALTDESGDSNSDQEFYVVLVNTGEEDKGFRLNYAVDMGTEGPQPAAKKPQIDKKIRPVKQTWMQNSPPPPSLESADIGSESDEFFVSDDLEDTSSYKVVDATLWGLGEYVAIWVDNDVAIDWDFECDGIIDQPHQFDAYGFDNCDLQTVADIVDNNIIVNFRNLFADESDINGDGRISVVITPVLNSIPLTSADEDDWYRVLGSYADPSVDLEDFDYQVNPGSDEQEVIYVFAPDPHGFYNPYKTTTVDTYTSQELVGQIAISYLQLIAYNQHVIVNEDAMEEAWLIQTLGTVGTDIVGFGAVFYQDAWKYMDAPHLFSLTPAVEEGEECNFFCGGGLGAQYLFGRWLVDKYGEDVLSDIASSENTGTDAVEDATGVDMVELVLEWQVALLTTGVMNEDGDSLMNLSNWPPYRAATTISAPTTPPATPTAGVYYGANGHQAGFNVRGVNKFMEGGTTNNPAENLQRRVRTEGVDTQIYTPGFSYFGYIAGYYGASVARLAKLPYDSTLVEIQGGDGSLEGIAIRWNDSDFSDVVEENIFSALDSNAMAMPPLPEDGSEIHALGEISEPGATLVLSPDGDSSSEDVQDVDRWRLDLTDRPPGDLIQVAIWLDRRYTNIEGDPGPFDPWIAIVLEELIPKAEVGVTVSDSTCSDGATWAYPNSLLASVSAQLNLSVVAYLDGDNEFDACGVLEDDPLTCGEDWDGDGVSDESEPSPASFVQQVMIEQCTQNNGVMPTENVYSSQFVDLDEIDDDDQFSFSAVYNVGGKTGEDGEEALLYAVLEGGESYVVVVSGGDGDTGAYELHARQLN
jgi:hypothetical protein